MVTHKELLSAISSVDKHLCLQDCCYDVRDRVFERYPEFKGNPWEHESVLEYGNACAVIFTALKEGIPDA